MNKAQKKILDQSIPLELFLDSRIVAALISRRDMTPAVRRALAASRFANAPEFETVDYLPDEDTLGIADKYTIPNARIHIDTYCNTLIIKTLNHKYDISDLDVQADIVLGFVYNNADMRRIERAAKLRTLRDDITVGKKGNFSTLDISVAMQHKLRDATSQKKR